MAQLAGVADRAVDPAEAGGPPPGPGPGARVLKRSRRLPGGRAVTGGFLVAVAVVGVFAASAGRGADHRQPFVVARHQLRIGTRLTAADLTVARMQLPAGLAGDRAFHRPAQIVGATVVGPIGGGELVQASSLVSRSPRANRREITVPLDVARAVGGRLVPGDRVDVAATLGTGTDATTSYIVRGATVVATDGLSGSLGDRGHQVVTLALDTPDEALAVANAIAAGQISLVQTTGVDQ